MEMIKIRLKTKKASCGVSPGTYNCDAKIKFSFKGSQRRMEKILKAIEQAFTEE